MTAPGYTLPAAGLHDAVHDPLLGSLTFLNEIMRRYPDALSFAPGAPNLSFLADFDLHRTVERFLAHAGGARLLYEYGPTAGIINDLVADALRADYGIDVPDEAIVVTAGAQEAILLALRVLCRPGDLLAAVQPCFVGLTGAARLLDIGVVPIDETPRTGDAAAGVDLDQLAAACQAARVRGRRIRALYVAPDFANPSGTVLPLAARSRLLDLAESEDFLVLEDTAYGFTAEPGTELPSLKALDRYGRVLMISTFAKVCLPGARVGFVVADQPVTDRDGGSHLLAADLTAAKSMVTVNTSPIGQAVVGGMLLERGGSLAALGREKSGLYRRNLALLLQALDARVGDRPAVTWNRPVGGFFVRMRLPVPADADLLRLSAEKFGVIWTPMAAFHLDGRGTHELRLSCSYLQPGQITEGVGRLAGLLDHIGSHTGKEESP